LQRQGPPRESLRIVGIVDEERPHPLEIPHVVDKKIGVEELQLVQGLNVHRAVPSPRQRAFGPPVPAHGSLLCAARFTLLIIAPLTSYNAVPRPTSPPAGFRRHGTNMLSLEVPAVSL